MNISKALSSSAQSLRSTIYNRNVKNYFVFINSFILNISPSKPTGVEQWTIDYWISFDNNKQ